MTLEHALTQMNTILCMKNMFIINIFILEDARTQMNILYMHKAK